MNEKGEGRARRRIGLVINPSVKPNRDVHLGIVKHILFGNLGKPLLFMAGSGTLPANVKAFAENRLDGMIFCGMRRDVLMDFLRLMPDHPPIVVCTYAALAEDETRLLGYGGEVVLDNESIGVRAADFFIAHGLRNFAFVGANVYYQRIAAEIRSKAFQRRIEERLGSDATFANCMVGIVKENGDFWEVGDKKSEEWLRALPQPCGVLVNSDREAANVIDLCNQFGIKVPENLEVLGINNIHGFCEQMRPAISSLQPDYVRCAREAVDMLMALIADPNLPSARRKVLVASSDLIERGSTSNGEFGHIVARAREYIIKNACQGIGVMDVVVHVGVSRRLLEKRIRDATGQSVLDMIQKVRLKSVCRLLATTTLPISEVTRRSGYEQTSNLSRLFRAKFGLTMRDYRIRQHGKA